MARIPPNFDAGRQRLSWATELCAGIVNTFLSAHHNFRTLNELASNICVNPSAGFLTSPDDQGSFFVWGNVRSLVTDLNLMINRQDSEELWNAIIQRNLIPKEVVGYPRLVIHAETWTTVPQSIWAGIQQAGAHLYADLSQAWKYLIKADIFVIQDGQLQVLGLSVKTGTGESEVKLSQQSTPVTYNFVPNSFTLSGGLGIRSIKIVEDLFHSIKIPDLRPSNTALDITQFNKLNTKDRKYAVIKYRYAEAWKEMIERANQEAKTSLGQFSEAISGENEFAAKNLQELLRHRLAGGTGYPGMYELWLSSYNGPVNLTAMFNREEGFPGINRLWGEFREATSGGIDSLVIRARNTRGKEYVVCKIQPSFDGWQQDVSQTKGIIYYFQEGRQLGMPTVWDLLEDTSSE